MDFELERRRALPLLRRLRSELATHGCSVAMLDSRPCLTVATHHLQASLSILVDATATHFTWTNGKHRHPVDDVPCAVLAIVVCIRCRERASDEPVHIRAPDDRQPSRTLLSTRHVAAAFGVDPQTII